METIYVTKYALTAGIEMAEAEVETDACKRVFAWVKLSGHEYKTYLSAKDFKKTEKDAIVDANERKSSKIASLRRQIEKLEKMKF